MRIVHVISSLDRTAGGPPVALAGLAMAQRKLGAEVEVVSTFNAASETALADELRAAGLKVTMIGPVSGKIQRDARIRPTLKPIIERVDVVHIHTIWEDIQHQAAKLARELKKPYVFVPQGMLDPWSLSQRKWVKRIFLALRVKRDLNGASFIHALNQDEANLIGPLGIQTRSELIPNGVDLSLFRPLPPKGTFWQRHPEIGDHPYVLFLSRLHYKKGLDYLADSFAIVAKQRPNVRLVVAGPDDGAEKDFDARIAAAGLTDRVFRVGPLYDLDKSSAMVDAELFVLPSRQEGLSVATVEAMACRTPAVITEGCHFPEVGEAGAGIVTPLDASAIANAMLQLLNDPALRERMAAAAIQLGEAYSWDRIAAKTFKLYGRSSVAIIANSLTPYRLAFHRRLVNELPAVKLHSVFTHKESNSPWEQTPPAEIGPVRFDSAQGSWRQGGEIIKWIKRVRPSVIIVNGYSDLARLRVLRWCHRNEVPVFLWGDSNIKADHATGTKAVAKSALMRWAIRQSSGVLSCGSLGQQYFEKYGADPSRITWMPYEPDYEQIKSVSADQIASARKRFGLAEGRHCLVYSGRLITIKRVDLLLKAFGEIAAERPEWDLVIIGDGPLRESLEASVPPTLKSRVIWTGFIDNQSAISAIYRCCDVLVHPAEVEPWALVINEAAAAGLAIVASDAVGAAAELVRDGVNGRVFRSGDSIGLRTVLLDVTIPVNTTKYRAASADVLAAWRNRADPVAAVRNVVGNAGTNGPKADKQ
jgi:glycosyltransferase involved in cell wall biosynthesis